jgi:benzoate transport
MSHAAGIEHTDIRAEIENGPMSRFQIRAIAICWTINLLDGFDILAIAYTAAEIRGEWGIMPAELGIVFSAGLFGMMAGALLLAPIGDYIGRRAMILIGLAIITLGMFVTAYVDNVMQMVAARAFTGIGIGTILASLTTITAEYASNKHRDLAISVLHMGYPVGAVLGGLIAVVLIGEFGWPSVFIFGGSASAIMIPLVLWYLPESLGYLIEKQPSDALRDFNDIMARMGRPSVEKLPKPKPIASNADISVFALFSKQYLAPTLAIWFSFFMCMVALYFMLSWTPTVVVNAGLTNDQGRFAGVLLNLGGAILMVLLGWLAARFPLKRVIQVFLALSAIMSMVFSGLPLPTSLLMVFAFLMGFEMAGMVGLYSVAARLYPTEIRNTGVGWAIGIGRWGAVFGPLIGGWMIAAGMETWTYYLALAAGPAALAALVISFVRLDNETTPKM